MHFDAIGAATRTLQSNQVFHSKNIYCKASNREDTKPRKSVSSKNKENKKEERKEKGPDVQIN